MKILFVSAVFPYPLHSGGQVRIFNLLKRLSKKHDITLVSFIRDEKETMYRAYLPFCKQVHTILRGKAWQAEYVFKSFGRYPFLLATYDNANMREFLQKLLSQHSFDLLHLEPFYVWPSIPKNKLPIVVGEHNVEHEVYVRYVRQFPIVPLRPLLYLDTIKLRYWEEYVWKKATAVTAVSHYDANVIGHFNKNVYQVPNGVDLASFRFQLKKSRGSSFLYVGNFTWMENRDAATHLTRDIWPKIKTKIPNATLRIVGKGAPDGEVQNIEDELHKADIMIAPIRVGGGTKFKILEAMAAGLPVITTSIGAEGFDKNVLWIANKPDEVLDAIESINTNAQKVKKARQLVEQEYNWDRIALALDHVWTSL